MNEPKKLIVASGATAKEMAHRMLKKAKVTADPIPVPNGSLLFIVTSSYDLGRQNFRPRSLLVILLPAVRALCPWGMRGSMPSVRSAFPILKRQGSGSILRLPDLNEKDICPQACMSKYGARSLLSALG